MTRRPTSSLAACVWIPLFPLRCEEARHEGLATYPTALLAPDYDITLLSFEKPADAG